MSLPSENTRVFITPKGRFIAQIAPHQSMKYNFFYAGFPKDDAVRFGFTKLQKKDDEDKIRINFYQKPYSSTQHIYNDYLQEDCDLIGCITAQGADFDTSILGLTLSSLAIILLDAGIYFKNPMDKPSEEDKVEYDKWEQIEKQVAYFVIILKPVAQ